MINEELNKEDPTAVTSTNCTTTSSSALPRTPSLESTLVLSGSPPLARQMTWFSSPVISTNSATSSNSPLAMQYCHKYNVVLNPEKTNLQFFLLHHSTKMFRTSRLSTTWLSMVSPSPSLTAPSMWPSFGHQDLVIFLTSHKNALNGVLSNGLFRSFRGNPAVSLQF